MRFKQNSEGYWMPVNENAGIPVVEPVVEPVKSFSEMTDEELSAIAAEREIDISNIKTRAALIKTLEKTE